MENYIFIFFFVYLFFFSFEKSNPKQWNNRYILAKKNRVKLFVFLITEPNDIHT
jgi:hypothetical protein